MSEERPADWTESLSGDAGKQLDVKGVGDRYVLLDPIGEGGSAVVYTAYDRKLDRKIAIKVLRRAAGAGEDRLLREAQALARLRHPNVVTVHDAGSSENRVFVALELVEGQSLRGWLAAKPRSFRETLGLFMAAGRGLAAAHAAGLVHRDFKPDNVLVGTDGSVRVADFGLARLSGESAGDPAESARSPLELSMTRTGAILGTPRYMSPEQLAGATADERSDQFSFCAALYEALYRDRPFAGDDLATLRANVTAGKVRKPPRRGVPGWLAVAVLRGLLPAPGDRWPSLADLLAELERDRGRVRRRVLAGAGAAVAVSAFVAVLAVRRGAAADACAVDPARLAGTWDEPTRAALHQAFVASGKPNAEDQARRAEQALDAYAAALTAMRREACQATAVRHEQSETLLDLRMACLDRRLGALHALTELLRRPENVTRQALPALQKLPSVDECADTEMLTSAEPLPPRALRPAVAAARQRAEHLHALAALGQNKAGLAEAPAVLAEARRIGWAPLVGDLQYTLGLLEQDSDPRAAEAALEEALLTAASAKNDTLTALADGVLIFVVGAKQARTAEALAMVPLATAAMRRIGDPPRLRGLLLSYVGYVQLRAAKFVEARASFEAALATLERARDARPMDTGRVLSELMMLSFKMERFDEAAGYGARALDLLEKAYGSDAYEVGTIMNELGGLAMARHDLVAGRRYYERAMRIIEQQLGAHSLGVATVSENLGDVALAEGHLDDARAAYEREVALRTDILGPADARTAHATMKLGEALLRQGKLDEARARIDPPLAVIEKTLDPDDEDLAEALLEVAELRRAEHAPDRAVAPLQRALAIFEKWTGPNSLTVLQTLVELGGAYLEAHRAADALPPLERAASLIQDSTPPSDGAAARFGLARALRGAGKDAARAEALARQARAGWQAASGHDDDLRAVDAWLAGR